MKERISHAATFYVTGKDGMISNFLLYILQYLALHTKGIIYIMRMSEKLDKHVMVRVLIVTKS